TPTYHKVLSLLLCTLMLSACSEDPSTNKHKKPAHLVETTTVSLKEVSLQTTLPGTLEASRTVRIFNQEQGLLKSLPFYESDPVKQNDLLASLDDALIRSDLNKAIATLKQSELDLKRLKNLVPRKLASEDQIAKAKTAVSIAQSEVNRNQTRLKHTQITAPFDGVISERLIEPGDVIPLYSHMLTLIDISSLKVRVYVSELLLPLIKQNDPVSIKIDALGDQAFDGQINRIHPTIDADTRRGVVEINIKPAPDGALPGQLCRITLSTEIKPRRMIPFDAVRHDNQGTYVFRIENNKARRINIRTGIQHNQDIEILEGLKENDIIVSKGFFGLDHDKEVTTN
ncbi:MAG: efflux RND transporter periplasmic adaptor subunit, partial [Gammaproteobacteria bacterium]|nr:efflux RND transporter periplasmic adaptor subunit [Gammaproteobacteria bacterium]